MNKLINELFDKDIVVKVVSVLIAIFIWFLIQDQDNPFTERTISVPLTSNVDVLESRNLQIVGGGLPVAVTVKIKGRRQRLDSVTANDFKVTADLSEISESGTHSIEIQPPEYTGNTDIIISGMSPTSFSLRLEKMIGRPYPVNVEFTGDLPNGYAIVNKRVNPDSVIIQDRESTLAKVNKVVVPVDLKDLSVTKDLVIQAVVYDTSGKPMTQYGGKYPAIVSYDIARELPVSVSVAGKPQDGFYFKEIILDTPNVSVIATKEILDSLTKINAEAVNIEGKSGSFITDLSLVMPKGVSLLDIDAPVSASVLIEPLSTRIFTIPTNTITIHDVDTSGALEYRLSANSFNIVAEGRPEAIEALKLSDIRCSISVRNLREGEHLVPVNISLPAGISLKERVNVRVLIEANIVPEEPPTPTPEPSEPTPAPGE
jgi:YbbR domain-containing protein